ncbi:glycosyltransferase [Seonamhaeicola sp. S2-3]|uniref:glycosyltransferase family 2 protein n=1 Tax=Seonamhaeicola sp. S2-3 TaxID=1936081 RepID=UPI00097288A2|nr:glycosyltransferase [Seonamhaeicola sp. S2-3]APY10097.1 glycosyltransferase [Seonamhaeicola sp. S2-3]
MSLTPQVSVICTCYNHQDYVLEALNSIINQTYNNIQIIITDDCSTDNSVTKINQWLEKHSNILFLKNQRNLGNTQTFNNAIKYATGEYIVDFAADDILLNNCVEEQVRAFNESKYKDLAIVYGNIDLIDENNNYISIYYDETETPNSGDIYEMVIGRTTKICSVAAMIKKSVFDEVGGYDESLAYEDLDLWVRISRNYSFQYIPLVLAQKRELSNSLSANFLKKGNLSHKLHTSTLKILEKILKLNSSKSEYRIMLKRVHFEIFKFIKAREFMLLFKLLYIGLKALLKSV